MVEDILIRLKGDNYGLHIIFGLPRTGKTYIIKKIYENIGDEISSLLYQDEFDGNILASNFIEDHAKDIANFFCLNSNKEILLIDSFKKILYTGDSFRRGGISNHAIFTLTNLNQIVSHLRKKVLLSFSPSSISRDQISELVTMLASCTANFYCINYDREILIDSYNCRIPISEIMNHVLKYNDNYKY